MTAAEHARLRHMLREHYRPEQIVTEIERVVNR